MPEELDKEGLRNLVREVPDFPHKGVGFKDITTLLKDKRAFKKAVNLLVARYRNKNINKIVAVESRGFILGACLAYELGTGFVPVRKKGKLPAKTVEVTYNLEYGQDTLQLHQDAIAPRERVLIVDDLLATGGTAKATIALLKQLRARIIGMCFLIELTFLHGRQKLKGYPVYSLIKY